MQEERWKKDFDVNFVNTIILILIFIGLFIR